MAKNTIQHQTVDDFIQATEGGLQELLKELRQILTGFSPELGEQIKWNSPAYFYTGEMSDFDAKTYARDFVVLNCHRGYVLMVFPNGAQFPDPNKILEGQYTDGRRMISIKSIEDIHKKTEGIKSLTQAWINTLKQVN
jgi:hypothetical protein